MAIKDNDFNGDGKSDILLRNANGQLAVWLSGAANPVNVGPALPSNVAAKYTGDWNGDSKADIFLRYATGEIDIWTMDGTTRTATQALSPNQGSGWTMRGVGDFNADGKTDILMNHITSQPGVWMGGGALVHIGGPLSGGWTVRGAGDYDGDGKADTYLQHNTGLIEVWLMNGNVRTGVVDLTPNQGTGWRFEGTGDFNGDGRNDVLMQNAGGQMAIRLAGSTALSNTGAALGSNWQIKGTGDYNGDGKSDIFIQHISGVAEVWQMNGAAPASYQGLNPGRTRDVLGNAREPITSPVNFTSPGILVQNHNTGQLGILNGGGIGTSVTAIGEPLDSNHAFRGTGDSNGDGAADIFIQNADSGQVQIWDRSTSSAITYQYLDPGAGWTIKAIADFSDDLKSDILFQHSNGQMAVWLGGEIGMTYTGNALGASWTIKGTDDVNSDGRSDIILQHSSGVSEAWIMKGATPVAYQQFMPNFGASWQIKAFGDFQATNDALLQNTNGQMALWKSNAGGLSHIGAPLDPGWEIRGTRDSNYSNAETDIILQHSGGVVEGWIMRFHATSSAIERFSIIPPDGKAWLVVSV